MIFWAKMKCGTITQTVEEHGISVANTMRDILRAYPDLTSNLNISENLLLFLAYIHDVGKIFFDFQKKSPAWLALYPNLNSPTLFQKYHDQISQESLEAFLPKTKSNHLWSAILGMHHGRVYSKGYPRPFRKLPDIFVQNRLAFIQKAYEYYNFPEIPEITKDDPRIWLIAGLISLADWIGSGDYNLASIGLGSPKIQKNLSFQDIFGFSPNDFQENIFAHIDKPGIYVINAQMGCGKTEAALYAAYLLMQKVPYFGLFFALPTQATSTNMFDRFQKFVQKIAPITAPSQLIHGNSWLQAKQEDEYTELNWFTSTKKALFASFGVGTIDQLLQSVLATRYFQLRRFAVYKKIFILDEIHSYDAYTSSLLTKYIQANPDSSIFICSATLTQKTLQKLLPNTPYTLLRETKRKEEKKVMLVRARDEEVLDKISDFLAHGTRILWIANTVAHAQQAYTALHTKFGRTHVGLLHARLPYFYREHIEKTWFPRFAQDANGPCILVSTQIVEQSVNLDADCMVSELAPIDILLQRLGRLWRFFKKRPYPCTLFLLDTDNISGVHSVYDPYILLRTREVLPDTISIPSDIQDLIDSVYTNRDEEGEAARLKEKSLAEEYICEQLAQKNSYLWQETTQNFCQTRKFTTPERKYVLIKNISGDNIVLLENEECVNLQNINMEVVRKLYRNTIKIPDYIRVQAIHHPNLAKYHLDGCLCVSYEYIEDIYANICHEHCI